MIVDDMSEQECLAQLAAGRLARLGCARGGRPYLVPIFYAYRDHFAYAFSLEGLKLEIMRANPQVTLLVEEKQGTGWSSVLAEGRFEELPDQVGFKRARDEAWTLLADHVDWWQPGGLKPGPLATPLQTVFFRIHVERVSGRRGRPSAD